MKIALAQLNPTVGAVRSNASLAVGAAELAADEGARLVVTPELLISGYPPKDLLLRQSFVESCDQAVERLARDLPAGMAMLVGHPTHRDVPAGRIANAASLLCDGRIQQTIQKMLLPTYDVFDEQRYFRAAETIKPIRLDEKMLGVHICEDAWWGAPDTVYDDPAARQFDPISALVAEGVDLLINLSASPFEIDKPDRRMALFSRHVQRHAAPVAFVNQVGGNDDLVFDGHSFFLGADGSYLAMLPGFQTGVEIVDTECRDVVAGDHNRLREADLLDALTLGLGDYMRKCGFTDCVLGLSGGIDSAVAACVAARAVGPSHVHALLMPSRFSSDHSVEDALNLATRLQINHEIVGIEDIHAAYGEADTVGNELKSDPAGLAEQNLQARIRGALVMLRSNHNGWLALATGNKSELAIGYCTLYGDMAGGFAVLCDVFKRDVYGLARHINSSSDRGELIPKRTISKPPSAELAPEQFDQDTLPEYPLLDSILKSLVEDERSVSELA
ncbi:MAG: NAD+ synthase, partial [Planctomycetaceae bacterium]